MGCTIYEMVSGKRAFEFNRSIYQLRILKGDVKFDDEVWKNVSNTVIDFIKQLLEVDPKKRILVDEIYIPYGFNFTKNRNYILFYWVIKDSIISHWLSLSQR